MVFDPSRGQLLPLPSAFASSAAKPSHSHHPLLAAFSVWRCLVPPAQGAATHSLLLEGFTRGHSKLITWAVGVMDVLLKCGFPSRVKDLFHHLETTPVVKKTSSKGMGSPKSVEVGEIHTVIHFFVNGTFFWGMVSCWSVVSKYYNNSLFVLAKIIEEIKTLHWN